MTHYETLGIARTATIDEIRHAYRKLAFDLHPDRNLGDKVAEQRFKEVQIAYDVLTQKRESYDAQFDTFTDFVYDPTKEFGSFSAGRRYSATEKELESVPCQFFGSNVLVNLNVPEEELRLGTAMLVRWKKCVKCSCSVDERRKCLLCKGKGIGKMMMEEMVLEIPAGTPSGHQIVVRGRGSWNPAAEIYGNLHVLVL